MKIKPPAIAKKQRSRFYGVRRHMILILGACLLGLMSGLVARQFIPSLFQTGPDIHSSRSGFSARPSWSQDFVSMADGRISNQIWRYELDPEVPTRNNEAQAYTDSTDNIRIENGALVIEARRTTYQYADGDGTKYEITSARIDTRNSLNFSYGKIEARMKMPKGSGTWPAIWLLSANQPHTGRLNPTESDWKKENFYKKDGELDIAEAYGKNPGSIEATVHTYDKVSEQSIQVDASRFHDYGVELTPDKITWTIDGKPYHSFTKPSNDTDKWPFTPDNKLYLILNLAMGSDGGEIDPSVDSWQMEVSKIEFFKYIRN